MNEMYLKYLVSFSFLVLGFAAGFIIEKFLMSWLGKAVAKTRWKGDEVIVHAFRGLMLLLGILTGGYFTAHDLPLSLKTIRVVDHVILSLVVFIITVFTSRVVVGFIRSRTSRSLGLLRTGSIMANIARIVIFVIGILIILQEMGISVTPLLTALGVGGLAVALALQDTLSNLFSGIQVIASRQVKPGDYIKLASGEEGYVTDITWRNTTIRMLSNNIVVVPNAKLASNILTNYYLPDREISVSVELSVSYDSDLEQVEKVVVHTAAEVIRKVQGSVHTHQPFIRYHTFGDSGIGFSVILRGQEFTDQYLIKHEFVKALHESFREQHIEIPYPMRTVTIKREQLN